MSVVFAVGLFGVGSSYTSFSELATCHGFLYRTYEAVFSGTERVDFCVTGADTVWVVPTHVEAVCFGTCETGVVVTELFIVNPFGFATFGTAARTVGSTGLTVL